MRGKSRFVLLILKAFVSPEGLRRYFTRRLCIAVNSIKEAIQTGIHSARKDLVRQSKSVLFGTAMIAISLVMVNLALISLTIAFIGILMQNALLWHAAIIVAGTYILIGLLLFFSSIQKFKKVFPQQAFLSLKKEIQQINLSNIFERK